MNIKKMYQLVLLLLCLQFGLTVNAGNSNYEGVSLSKNQNSVCYVQWGDLLNSGSSYFSNSRAFTAPTRSSQPVNYLTKTSAPSVQTIVSEDGMVLTMTGNVNHEITAAANKTIHLLSIGNSFSQDAQQWIYNIAKAAGYEDIIIANLYWGGCSLWQHADNAKKDFGGDGQHYEYQMHREPQEKVTRDKSIKGALLDQNWDYVTLQQVSQDAGMEKTFTNGDLDYLINYVKEYRPNAKIGWHMTWAYQQDSSHGGFANYNRDQMTMYNAIIHCTRDIVMKKDDMKFVFPAGTAVQNLRTSFIGDHITRDGYHMSYNLGRYLVGLTWIYKICEMQGNPFPEFITYTPNAGEVPEYYLPAIREAAKNAVLHPYEVTQSSYKNLSDLLKIDLNNYQQFNDWAPKENTYWHSAGNINQTLGSSESFITSKLFTKAELPIGTIIQVDNGWQFRPEAWETNTSTTNPRPDATTAPTTLVTDGWWGNFNYRAFNVSKTNNESLIGKTNEAREHFRIYLPKVLGNGGKYRIISKKSGKPLAIKNDSKENNAGLVQKSNSNSDIWTFEYANNGYYYIINDNSGKALDMPGGSTQADTQPGLWDLSRNNNQQWDVVDLTNGMYRISARSALSMALDVVGESVNDDANVVQWPYGGKDNEIWYIEGIPEIIPYVSTDYNKWDQTNSLTLEVGKNFWIGPWAKVGDEQGPFVAGTWNWTGPNGFSSNEREININNIQDNQFGSYVATFTTKNGSKATYTLTVNKAGAVNPDTPVDPTPTPAPTPTVPTTGKVAYRLTNGNNSLFVKDASLLNNAEVVEWVETDVAAQQWFKVDAGNNQYRLQNVYTGLFLTVNNGVKQTGDKNDNGTKFNINGNNVNVNGRNYTLVEVAAQDEYTPELRDRVMAGYLAQFLQDKGGSFMTFVNGGWGESETLEVILDTYETSGNKQYLNIFEQCYAYFKDHVGDRWNGGTIKGGYDWFGDDYNDDVMWHIILAARAYKLTGNRMYLEDSRRNFDIIWDRACFNFVTMLRWAEKQGDKLGTTSCINGPAEVAACYIAEGYASLGDNGTANTYWNKARELYSNQKKYLYGGKGHVYDSTTFNSDGSVKSIGNWASTYNQGTMLGAAVLLHRHFGDDFYRQDAQDIFNYTMNNMVNEYRIIKQCEGVDDGSLQGFKGILMRYVRNYYEEFGDDDARSFLLRNAFHVYNNRNKNGFGLTNWRIKAPEDYLEYQRDKNQDYSKKPFSAGTVVSAAFNAPIFLPTGELTTVEVENMNLSGDAAKQTDGRASNGYYVNGIGSNGNNKATFTYNAPEAGKYIVDVYYCSAANRDIQVSANGKTSTVRCTSNGSWDGYTVTPVRVLIDLNAGQNTITLGNNNDWGPNLDKVVVAAATNVNKALPLREGGVLEAEDAELNGNVHIEYAANASRHIGVGNIGNNQNSLTFHYYAPKAGEYEIEVHYSSGLDRDMFTQVNGGEQKYESYPKSGNTWDYTQIAVKKIKVQLQAGENTIKFGNERGDGQYAPDLDYIVVNSLISEPDPVTVVEQVRVQQNGDGRVYNLNGQEVTSFRKGSVYIRNGKKFIVK